MSNEIKSVTELGNPRKPQGEAGFEMLSSMNEHHSDVTDWALGFLELNDDNSVLDIGCGGGATLSKIAGMTKSGHIMGIDYSDVSVRMSKDTNAEMISTGRMEIIEASVESLPLDDNSFDRIITVESFYFWPDPEANLCEVRRVLRTGGQFLLVADIYDTPDLSAEERANIERYELQNPTPEEFQRLFQAAGFREIAIHTQPGTHWICVEGRR